LAEQASKAENFVKALRIKNVAAITHRGFAYHQTALLRYWVGTQYTAEPIGTSE
jgi:hypothetical protein